MTHMNDLERVARALCKWERRVPDHCNAGKQPQWKRFKAQARIALWALYEAKEEELR